MFLQFLCVDELHRTRRTVRRLRTRLILMRLLRYATAVTLVMRLMLIREAFVLVAAVVVVVGTV